MYGITDLTTFILGTIFIVLLPGPNSVFVLSSAGMHGLGAGYRAAAGVFVGDTILMVLASTGAASVLYANPTLFMILKYAGAAYLAWIGFGLTRQAWTGWFQPAQLRAQATATTATTAAQPSITESPIDGPRELGIAAGNTPKGRAAWRHKLSNRSPFRGALLISLLNPKAIFFFISFFVQFVDPEYAYPVLTFLLLGIIVQICSVGYLCALIHGGARLAHHMRAHPKLNALSAGAVGAIFIWFGLKLADASLG